MRASRAVRLTATTLRARGLLCCAAAASLLAWATSSPASASVSPRCVPGALNVSSVLPGTSLSVSPLPGSYDASPATQISLLGAPAAALGGVRVAGSRSGAHAGRLLAYSQGDGASFVPSKPFAAGETVSVSGRVLSGGAQRAFSYRFVVAHEDPLSAPAPHAPSGHPYSAMQHYVSRPDLRPPRIAVTARTPLTAPGYIFASPSESAGGAGAMIFDEAGNLIWFRPLPAGVEAANLRVQQLGETPLLTWWQGRVPLQGFGEGEEVIADSSYHVVAVVRAGNGYTADLHDFQLTQGGTALLTVFDPIFCNLAVVGGPAAGYVTDSGFQELDTRTGLVRREWHALDHVALADSFSTPKTASAEWPFDFFHINSLDANGATTLVSARNTSALYELEAAGERVLRTIGGKHSDLAVAPGAATAFQHDATLLPNGSVSIFDNGADPKVHPQSRALVVSLAGRGAALVAQYAHPTALSAASEGSAQVLENGDVFVGWGAQPYFSEFNAGGSLLFDAHMAPGYESYRGYRLSWSGTPAEPPSIALLPARGRTPQTVYASWNGDTRTAAWRVLAGTSTHHLAPVASAPRFGFETAIPVRASERYLAVQALDSSGNAIGVSRVVLAGR